MACQRVNLPIPLRTIVAGKLTKCCEATQNAKAGHCRVNNQQGMPRPRASGGYPPALWQVYVAPSHRFAALIANTSRTFTSQNNFANTSQRLRGDSHSLHILHNSYVVVSEGVTYFIYLPGWGVGLWGAIISSSSSVTAQVACGMAARGRARKGLTSDKGGEVEGLPTSVTSVVVTHSRPAALSSQPPG